MGQKRLTRGNFIVNNWQPNSQGPQIFQAAMYFLHSKREMFYFFKDIAAWTRLKVPQEVIQETQQDTGLKGPKGDSVGKDLASKAEFESPVPM